MALPGYRAEVSLCHTSNVYRGHSRRAGYAVRVDAALIDPGCFRACYSDCNRECFELVGAARAACLRDCREVQLHCRAACTVPSCVPSTICNPDSGAPAGCLICHRDNCDGTGSVWHTC
jgi:hypothetical protein